MGQAMNSRKVVRNTDCQVSTQRIHCITTSPVNVKGTWIAKQTFCPTLSPQAVPSDIIYMSHTLFSTSPRLSATHTSWYKSTQIDAQICCSPKEDKAKTLCPRPLAASNIERFTDAVLSCEDKWKWKTQLSVNQNKFIKTKGMCRCVCRCYVR